MVLSNSLSNIKNILAPGRIRLNEQVRSKKKALELFAGLFSECSPDLHQDDILEALTAREKLGSTSLENGIALPHCRIAGCKKPMGAVLTLVEGVDFGARDNKPASLLWALIVPEEAENEHLNVLASIASLLSKPDCCEMIRKAKDNDLLYENLTTANSYTNC